MQTALTSPAFAAVDLNNPSIDSTNYLAPLPATIHAVHPLTAEETGCNIFALSSNWRRDEDESTTGRFAVVRPIARKDWARIEHGTPIIYTELHRWADTERHEYPGQIGTYAFNVGTFVLCDDKRNAFYASAWGWGNDDEPRDYTAADVFEVHTIERFIEIG